MTRCLLGALGDPGPDHDAQRYRLPDGKISCAATEPFARA